jgi:hypothetical protein
LNKFSVAFVVNPHHLQFLKSVFCVLVATLSADKFHVQIFGVVDDFTELASYTVKTGSVVTVAQIVTPQ